MASSLISRRLFLSPKPFPLLLLRACPPPPPPPLPFQVHSHSFSSNRRKKRLQKKFVPHQIPHPKITPPVDTPKTDDPKITPPSTKSPVDSVMVTVGKGAKFVETLKRGQDGFEYVLAIGGAGFNFYDQKLTAVKEYISDKSNVSREKFGLKGNSSPSPAGNTPSNTPAATTLDNPLLKELVDTVKEILAILKNDGGEVNRKFNGKAKKTGKVVKKGEGNGRNMKNGNGNGNGEEAQENGSDADSNE